MKRDGTPQRRGWVIAVVAAVWLALAGASWWGRSWDEPLPPLPLGVLAVDVAPVDRHGPRAGDPVRVAYAVWPARRGGAAKKPPVLMLHGSPGNLANFDELAPLVAATGRDVIALDLPGFGVSSAWAPDYSTRAHARYALALLDHLGIDRCHIVGWSMGGGVALEIDDLARERVASVTLLASIAAQETEGSGSYVFEHAKYAVGYAALVVGPELIPHFGAIDGLAFRHAAMRNFFDTDQRPYAGMLGTTPTPVLILHGARDFLVSARAAERHFAMTPSASLVMTAHDHFMPISQPEVTAEHVTPFLARHDEPGVPPQRASVDLAARPARGWLDAVSGVVGRAPWWLAAAVIAALARRRMNLTAAACLFFVADQTLDLGVAIAGLGLGNVLRPRDWWEAAGLRRWLARLGWPALLLLVGFVLTPALVMSGATERLNIVTATLGVVVGGATLSVVRRAGTREGRQRLIAAVTTLSHHEWWPSWMLYGALLPHLARLALRHGPMTWTCANPGVEPGGGVLGEEKSVVLEGFGSGESGPGGMVLPAVRLPRGDAEGAVAIIEADPRVGGFPCMLKPETGYRGVGVKVARGPEDVRRFLAVARRDVAAQRYHAGPYELGIFWVRNVATVGHEDEAAPPHGRVFAVTKKTFPIVTGDGRRTLRRLIMDHPRYRRQAGVYFRENAARLREVIAAGEVVTLTRTGNHMQGCVFTDGMGLVTPELSATVDGLMRAWRGEGGRAFDFGRFDVRYHDPADLAAGRGLAIIELNGVTSEATSLYDPGRSAASALALLRAQWSTLYELGAARRAQGRRPMSLWRVAWAMLTVKNR